MPRESSLWKSFRKALVGCFTSVRISRIENEIERGTPDVHFTGDGFSCWVELKVGKEPARANSPVKLEHFTMYQRQWLFDEIKAGGKAYLLLQIERNYYLIRGDVAAIHIGAVPFENLEEIAEFSGPDLKKLVQLVKKRCT